jgi:hypothetical protein
LPKAVLVGSNSISAAAQRMEKIPMQRMDGSASEIVGKIAIYILSVVGVIILAAGLPYLFFLVGIFTVIDLIDRVIFGRLGRSTNDSQNLQ